MVNSASPHDLLAYRAASLASGRLTRRGFLSAAGACAGLAASAALAGCAGRQGAGGSSDSVVTPKGSTQVVIAMNPTSEPAAGFDPLVAWGCGEHVHEPLIQSTLITTDEDLNFVNDLATDYLCSSDGLVWTFTIRDDVVFSDGEPLSARDVAFTVNGAIDSAMFRGRPLHGRPRRRRERHGGRTPSQQAP